MRFGSSSPKISLKICSELTIEISQCILFCCLSCYPMQSMACSAVQRIPSKLFYFSVTDFLNCVHGSCLTAEPPSQTKISFFLLDSSRGRQVRVFFVLICFLIQEPRFLQCNTESVHICDLEEDVSSQMILHNLRFLYNLGEREKESLRFFFSV